MNSKEFKVEKKLKKNKSNLKNGGQQIFVLPPNLLQKLGINLGNMETTHNSPDLGDKISSCASNHSWSNSEHEMNSNNINKETSITKTASLMKESVFLSPTFNNLNLNNVTSTNIEGYVEVCNAETNCASEKNESVFDISNVTSDHNTLNKNELEDKHDDNTNYRGLSNNINTQQNNGSTTSKESGLQNETKKVINIISEETVTVAKLSELKVLQIPPKNMMIPASLDTVIGTNVKNNEIKKSDTLPTFIQDITDNTNLQYNDFNDIQVNNEIEMPKTENIINIDSNIYHSTENFSDTDDIKKHSLNFVNNVQVSDNTDICDKHIWAVDTKNTNLSKSLDYNNDQIVSNSNTVNENNLEIKLCEDSFSIINNNVSNESKSTDQSFIEDIQSELLNKCFKKQLINNNNQLSNIHTNIIKKVNDNKLEAIEIDDVTQNIECYLPDMINSNNNTWDQSKSDVEEIIKSENEILKLRTTSCVDNDQQRNIEINSGNDSDNSSNTRGCKPNFIDFQIESSNMVINSKKGTSLTCGLNEKSSVDEQEISLKVSYNNTLISVEGTKSVKNQSICDTFDDGGICKLSLPLNPKRKNLMSKLCIQGVEKPGGNSSCTHEKIYLKTYLNKRKDKIRGKCFPSKETIFNVQFDYNSNIDLKEAGTNNLLPCQQFCRCCDYGILDYNQIENSYEHIHFTRRKSVDCSPDIIFSIYDNDGMNVGDIKENFDHVEKKDLTNSEMNSEHLGDYICWYNADSVEDKSETDFENSQQLDSSFNKHPQVVQLNEKDEYQIEKSTVKDYFKVKTHKNHLPDIMNMEASKEADTNCDTKNYDNKLDLQYQPKTSKESNFQNLSKKRKMSETCPEVSNNKKVKSVPNRDVSNEIITETQQNDHGTKHGFKSWRPSDNVANVQQLVKCAVCGINVTNAEWSTHIATKHDYIAWKEGEPPVNLEDEVAVRDHLHQVGQRLGELQCSNCGLIRKYAKAFLHHLKSCYGSSDINDDSELPYHLSKLAEVSNAINCSECGRTCKNGVEYATHVKKCNRKSGSYTRQIGVNTNEDSSNVTCGVCKAELTSDCWLAHIQQEHGYQAWREGERPLNVEDEESVRKHLYRILHENGPLVCSKCGKSRKYVKLFLQHIATCTGSKEHDITLDTSSAEWESVLDTSLDDTGTESTQLVKCGPCQLEMESKQWISHIREKHNYLSWQEGKTPLDILDEELVRRYLYVVVQKLGALVCAKCGVARKYVKNYLSHIQNCMGPPDSDGKTALPTVDSQLRPVKKVKCGVCQKEMNDSNWITHTAMNHEYIAWKETDTPIDLSSHEAIFQHLKNLISEIGALKCADCGRKCKHANAFLSHIKSCYGKSYVAVDDDTTTLDDSASEEDATSDTVRDVEEDDTRAVTCGVCGERTEARRWVDHIHRRHDYLAWRDGEAALDLENKELIRSHLKGIARRVGRLTCARCGARRRKAMSFYTHVKRCDGARVSIDKSLQTLKPKLEDSPEVVKCGVCQCEVSGSLWINHIATKHEYMAWRCGDTPLDVDDETSVKDHLYKIAQVAGELICSKCEQSRKNVGPYLQHTRRCTGFRKSTDGAFKLSEPKKESSEIVTCALCRLEMKESKWMKHISKEHNYVSWKQNDPPLTFKDETSLRDYLHCVVQSVGGLECSKCGLVRKYAKSYLQHIETCQRVTWKSINKIIMKMKKEKGDIVRCAVCGVEVDDTEWAEHIAARHNYLAWRDRDPAVNLDDEDDVRRHLKSILEEEGYLKCPKCNLHRKYVKLYLHHVETCDGTKQNGEMNESHLLSDDDEMDSPGGSAVVKCGVCAQEVARSAWGAHIQREHNYLAWADGDEPLDVNDKEAVYSHLSGINVRCRGLTCGSCGVVRKYVKAYLHHVRDCTERNYIDSDDVIECGVCGEKLIGKLWREHAMQTHYNIAWVAGDKPIDVRSFFSVDKYLKEYQEYNHKLVCNICGLSRASLAGFYAHILICGKTDEEIDSWKDVCDICNQKYLCIYKTQHYWAHRVQEVAKERKIQDTLKKEESLKDQDTEYTPGRRRAAEKARSVIGDYVAKFASYKCKSCPFETDSKEDLASHHCGKRALNLNEDSDESASIKLEDFSEEESEDTVVDSDLSNDDEENSLPVQIRKKSKNDWTATKVTTKSSKFPFEVKDARPYLQQSKSDHFELFYTRETLFTQWRDCTYEVVPDDLIPQYMPQLEESCKVSISNGSWTTYKRFESKRENGCKILFTGGCIQCIAWAPEHPDSTPACPSLLAVATHRGPDCPRLHPTDTPSHPALIQMWNFQTFKCVPKLAFGLAHDYGTVWAMDWCPSGARDIAHVIKSEDTVRPRLGLLAMACSNGSAYVVSVPYPDVNRTSDITFYKIKPCVELRVTRGTNKYQATSVNWCLFKGYTTISVGYGDGTVALYDLATESPLLRAKEAGVHVLYPFQDERVHNSCVTALTSCVLGAWCSSSATGSTAGVADAEPRAGRGARPLRTHSALAAASATFMPHWPNVMLSGDDTIVGLSPSELEWGYHGRRVGSVRALAPCVHRARVVGVVPPLLQVMRAHPAAFKGHKTIHKKNVAMIQMTPLARKRSKHSNDELSMKVEPVTYEDAVAIYGIEFKYERDFDKPFVQRMQQKHRVPFPERFPLGDVPALAYCPAAAHYTKLAVATHGGLLLLLDV